MFGGCFASPSKKPRAYSRSSSKGGASGGLLFASSASSKADERNNRPIRTRSSRRRSESEESTSKSEDQHFSMLGRNASTRRSGAAGSFDGSFRTSYDGRGASTPSPPPMVPRNNLKFSPTNARDPSRKNRQKSFDREATGFLDRAFESAANIGEEMEDDDIEPPPKLASLKKISQ